MWILRKYNIVFISLPRTWYHIGFFTHAIVAAYKYLKTKNTTDKSKYVTSGIIQIYIFINQILCSFANFLNDIRKNIYLHQSGL
jgi:hypothetical protein